MSPCGYRIGMLGAFAVLLALAAGAAPPAKPAGTSGKRPKTTASPAPAEWKLPGSGFTLQNRTSLNRDAEEYLGTPATERAVRRALQYLAQQQNRDGGWGDQRAPADVAIVGLCSLAFMSAGHQPDRGPYGTPLRKATDYLARYCQQSGLIVNPNAAAGPPMYGHGFATLALAELYGMTRRTDLRDPLEATVTLILRTQNEEGGWRYQPRVADADLSVVICQIMALRAAANAGVRVPKATTSRAIAYVRRCANNRDGGFSYKPTEPGSSLARTGAGVLSLIVMGERNTPECERGLDYIVARTPTHETRFPSYSHYYCTQATYQAGGKYWRYWYPLIADHLTSTQRADGSWNDNYGYPYATAMGVLALQVPAALLPIYQK